MRSKLFFIVFALLASGTLAGAQTDVGLSLYGAFSGRTDANGVSVSPANSAGGIIELRHLANPIFGFEGTYSYNRANERYSACSPSRAQPLPIPVRLRLPAFAPMPMRSPSIGCLP